MGESVTGDTQEGPREEKEEAASLQAGTGLTPREEEGKGCAPWTPMQLQQCCSWAGEKPWSQSPPWERVSPLTGTGLHQDPKS